MSQTVVVAPGCDRSDCQQARRAIRRALGATPTTQPGGRWFLVNGSSYAAAHVSGLFALLREKGSRARSALTLVAMAAGGGRIDACATLVRASGSCECACAREYSALARQ